MQQNLQIPHNPKKYLQGGRHSMILSFMVLLLLNSNKLASQTLLTISSSRITCPLLMILAMNRESSLIILFFQILIHQAISTLALKLSKKRKVKSYSQIHLFVRQMIKEIVLIAQNIGKILNLRAKELFLLLLLFL